MSTATLTRPAVRSAAPRPGTRRSTRPVARVRLTRRGQVLVVAVLAALLLAAFTLGRPGASQADTEAPLPAALGVTTVHPGETLWGVARRIAPDGDVRQVVAQIRELNDMGTSTLQAGQQLLLPTAG